MFASGQQMPALAALLPLPQVQLQALALVVQEALARPVAPQVETETLAPVVGAA